MYIQHAKFYVGCTRNCSGISRSYNLRTHIYKKKSAPYVYARTLSWVMGLPKICIKDEFLLPLNYIKEKERCAQFITIKVERGHCQGAWVHVTFVLVTSYQRKFFFWSFQTNYTFDVWVMNCAIIFISIIKYYMSTISTWFER